MSDNRRISGLAFTASAALACLVAFSHFRGGQFGVAILGIALAGALFCRALSLWRSVPTWLAVEAPWLLAAAWMPLLSYAEGLGASQYCYPVLGIFVLLAPLNALVPVFAVLWMTLLGIGVLKSGLAAFDAGIFIFGGVGSIAIMARVGQQQRQLESKLALERAHTALAAGGVPYVEFKGEGSHIHLSAPFCSLLGHSVHSVVERSLDDFVHPDDHARFHRAIQTELQQAAGAVHAACECRLIAADGAAVWVHVKIFRHLNDRGASTLYFTFHPIAERLNAEDAIRSAHRKIRAQETALAAQQSALQTTLQARDDVERFTRHELKTPLKSIENALSLLRKDHTLTAEQEQVVTMMERTIARTLSSLAMYSDIYRMEMGTYEFHADAIDLALVASCVVERVHLHSDSKQIRLDLPDGSGPLLAAGNGALVMAVLESLVRHAIEVAPEGSTVTLALYGRTRVGVILHHETVMTAEVLQSIFDKHAPHGKAISSGLGNYAARLVTRAQGGDLSITSSPTKGSTVTLKFRRPVARDAPEGVDESRPAELIHLSQQLPGANMPQLLVVEDDDHNWQLLKGWIPANIDARRAVNGRAGIDAVVDRRPDVILMDLEMPVMGGFDALTRIRYMQSSANEESSTIIAFTAHDDPETLGRIKAAGFDGYLAKPVVQGEFERVIATARQSARPGREGVWVDRGFAQAAPDFIASRQALASDMLAALEREDRTLAAQLAHKLAGSPALHGFEPGVAECRRIMDSDATVNFEELRARARVVVSLLATAALR